jgi:regulator of sirC expression with transglutaminase-like and TPR domain
MPPADIKKIRDRAALYLSDEVAASAGMSLTDLKQFVAHTYWPTDQQLAQLARRMKLTEKAQ